MPHTFLTATEELIYRCRVKVAKRSSLPATEDELQYGVPLCLKQLVGVLRHDEEEKASKGGSISGSPAAHTYGAKEADNTGALHGISSSGDTPWTKWSTTTEIFLRRLPSWRKNPMRQSQ